eukprot:TRINITY_DN18369_c0_g1_i1.p1 TRINITY_DN18369_c0_g1~~TRINITY_DN18369_c0_g1_i1.p1  ORF type:complete len:107 (+),score=28.70 TRINITY_DN18369_c0_g1_i1:158-478(+)
MAASPSCDSPSPSTYSFFPPPPPSHSDDQHFSQPEGQAAFLSHPEDEKGKEDEEGMAQGTMFFSSQPFQLQINDGYGGAGGYGGYNGYGDEVMEVHGYNPYEGPNR